MMTVGVDDDCTNLAILHFIFAAQHCLRLTYLKPSLILTPRWKWLTCLSVLDDPGLPMCRPCRWFFLVQLMA